MTIKECYINMEADYENAISRLGSEGMLQKYLLKYLQRQELAVLQQALIEKRYQDAFVCAHNMKGYSLNLSLTRLSAASALLCDALRSGEPTEDIAPLLAAVEAAYGSMERAVLALTAE